MRRTRWLIVAAISFILFTVGFTYYARVARLRSETPAPAKPLKEGLEGTAEGWHYSHNEGGCPVFDAHAQSFEQVKEPSNFRLKNVALQLFHECGKSADHVKTERASFDVDSGVMFSEDAVEITLGVPSDAQAKGRLLKIASSGVRFETKTGKVSTDREAQFSFDQGEGKSVGAEYDPNSRELHLKSQVDLHWRGSSPKATPMHVETGDLIYKERDSQVYLTPWAKLTRETLHMESEGSVVTLNDGLIRLVEAKKAKGVQDDPDRKVEYAADQLTMNMDDNGQVTRVDGYQNAKLTSTGNGAKTDVASDHIVMDFNVVAHESILKTALAMGKASIRSTPLPKPGAVPGDTRILTSETIEMKMREGGKDIETVQTQAPGVLEFVPNRPNQPHRTLNGQRIQVSYAPQNILDTFTSNDVTTRTDNPPRKPGEKRPPVLTSSKQLTAKFDPKTQQLTTLEQTTDFRYNEGDRAARSDKATLDQAKDLMTLTGTARVADPTGSTAADRIVMNQKTGDVVADGKVNSTRMPDKKKGSEENAMLSGDEPLQARANHMTTQDNNLLIHYDGDAAAWQGGNRIEADHIEIDRENSVLRASGKVVSQFVDKPKKGKDGKPVPAAQPGTTFTVVRAPSMVYTDDDRLAHYTGGAVMTRPNMTVKAREIRAFLKDAQSDSSLDKAIADGAVVIDQSAPGRSRKGSSEHAEYYAGEEKLLLTGGQPQMVDSLKGTTKGRELTYFSNDDRLLVNGAEAQRSESVIRRKK